MKRVADSRTIGRRSLLKFGLIGLGVLALLPTIAGLCMFSFSDSPINMQLPTGNLGNMILKGGLFVFGGYYLSKLLGGWAGTLILDRSYSPFLVSVSALAVLMASLICLLGLFILIAPCMIIALALGYLMGKETIRKKTKK